jgi:hypothetical protein
MTPAPTLSFVGDMSISWRQWPEFAASRANWTSSGLPERLATSALVIGNLECLPLPENWPSMGRTFSTVPDAALDYISALNVRCLTLANNHIMDSGADGLKAVIGEIESRNMQYFGAGSNLEVAERPLILTVGEQRVALLGACDASYAWATQNSAGVAPMILSRLLARLRLVRDEVDQVIFVLHAGTEFRTIAEHPRVKLCRALVESGATAIFQHHPHVVQPFEIWHGAPICYSLGNFCFEIDGNGYMQHLPYVRDGLIAHLSLAPGLPLAFDTVKIDSFGRPVLVQNCADVEEILRHGATILANPVALQAAWQQCADTQSHQLLGDAYWAMRRNGLVAGYKALQHSLRQPRLRDCLRTAISRGLF